MSTASKLQGLIKPYIPSRNWLIFLGTTGGVASLIMYDTYELKKVRKELAERASIISKQPLPIWEAPRKVRVYLAPSDNATTWFNNFVKPVFDAAGLDYQVTEPVKTGSVRAAVRDLIWTGKEELAQRQQKDKEFADAVKKAKASWLIPVPQSPTVLETVMDSYDIKYRSSEGLVAVGPEAWTEMLQGLNDGCLTERVGPISNDDLPKYPSPPFADPSKPTDSEREKIEQVDKDIKAAKERHIFYPTLDRRQSLMPDAFKVPEVGYLPGKNYTGWIGFFIRGLNWFNYRTSQRIVGEEALKIAFAATRPLDVSRDLDIGEKDQYGEKVVESGTEWEAKWAGPDPVVLAKMRIYESIQAPPVNWTTLDQINVTSLSGDKVPLRTIITDKKTVIIFLRRFSCATCYTYFILFNHLKPILNQKNTRLVFFTCHNDLSEVQVFLRSFAYWLRDLKKQRRGEEDDTVCALPGELYLDANRDAYRFFGLTSAKVPKFQLIGSYMYIRFLNLFFNHIGKKDRPRPKLRTRQSTLWDARRFVLTEITSQSRKSVSDASDSLNQASGICVVQDQKLLYRVLPDGGKLGEALDCKLETKQLDDVVINGMEQFMDAVSSKETTANVADSELKVIKKLGAGTESDVFQSTWMGITVAVNFTDLKSLNLLIAEDWTCKIADFGISKEQKVKAPGSDSEKSMGGTVQWMPPELMQGDLRLRTKIDVFAFGVIMWEVATRCKPWQGCGTMHVCDAVIAGQRPQIPQLTWTNHYKNLVADCWHQEPDERPEFSVICKILKKNMFTKRTPGRKPTYSNKNALLRDTRSYVQTEYQKQYTGKLDWKAMKQSPGIIVVENCKLLYRFVVRDQNQIMPDGERLGEALECKIDSTKDLDETVLKGVQQFMETVASKETKAQVSNEELVVIQKLGQGRESEVFKSKWMGIDVAVKYFRFQGGDGEEPEDDPLKSFANEAALLMSMKHPNIISFIGFGSNPPNHFMIMEFMNKGSLFDILGNTNVLLDAARKKSILLDCAKGMAFLHGCRPKVIHSDLKSLNLLVDDKWCVKVADFGIARELREEKKGEGEEDEESQGGTLQWMPPEVMLGSSELTTKVDIFAFGVIMWEVATRKRPWKNVPASVICQSVVAGQRPAIPPSSWSKQFTQLVENSWHQEPHVRPEFSKIVKTLEKLDVPDS
ncbi:hypothetical protein HDV05_001415 [Chytridiales sp. JEL 0842]|nr:hypothetical protein HDV05_001415 [Chytridiales sp. JEL 0842]